MSLSGKPLKLSIDSSVSGSWTELGANQRTQGMYGTQITGVLWTDSSTFVEPKFTSPGYYVSPDSGSYLQLRDKFGDIFYTQKSAGTSQLEGGAVIDILDLPIVMEFPISYFDSTGSNSIVIFAEYK